MKDKFRRSGTAKRYEEFRRSGAMDRVCALCRKESTRAYNHWKIVTNDYPYDLIAETHDMIVPKRHVREEGLTTEEIIELAEIKKDDLHGYDYIFEATHKIKSIPDHFHLHLIIVKKHPISDELTGT